MEKRFAAERRPAGSALSRPPYYEYFSFFARNPAARERGYYTFELGGWNVVSLNSMLPMTEGSAQIEWLENEHAELPPAAQTQEMRRRGDVVTAASFAHSARNGSNSPTIGRTAEPREPRTALCTP